MKTKEEILRILQQEKPELIRRYGVKRLALFGSYARDDQREDSDVDILVEVDPSIGLGFVELAERIEGALGVRAEVVSRRAIKPRYWEAIKEELSMSRRTVPLLVEDVWEAVEKIERYVSGLKHDAFVKDDKTVTRSCVIWRSLERPPTGYHRISKPSTPRSTGPRSLA